MVKKTGPSMSGDVTFVGFIVKFTLKGFNDKDGDYYYVNSWNNHQNDYCMTLNKDINCSTLFNTEEGADTESTTMFVDLLELKNNVFDEGRFLDVYGITHYDGIEGVTKEVLKVSRSVKTMMGDIYEQR